MFIKMGETLSGAKIKPTNPNIATTIKRIIKSNEVE
jgi:hypothetical protein